VEKTVPQLLPGNREPGMQEVVPLPGSRSDRFASFFPARSASGFIDFRSKDKQTGFLEQQKSVKDTTGQTFLAAFAPPNGLPEQGNLLSTGSTS